MVCDLDCPESQRLCSSFHWQDLTLIGGTEGMSLLFQPEATPCLRVCPLSSIYWLEIKIVNNLSIFILIKV